MTKFIHCLYCGELYKVTKEQGLPDTYRCTCKDFLLTESIRKRIRKLESKLPIKKYFYDADCNLRSFYEP